QHRHQRLGAHPARVQEAVVAVAGRRRQGAALSRLLGQPVAGRYVRRLGRTGGGRGQPVGAVLRQVGVVGEVAPGEEVGNPLGASPT
ncbi:MAG: hypothetical protein ACRDI2_25795, partial [Chloroflexota bacterium]